MPLPENAQALVEALRQDLDRSGSPAKRLKVRSLLKKFGFVKRSDGNTAEITELLDAWGIAINPPIIRLGEAWELTTGDWVYLSTRRGRDALPDPADLRAPLAPHDWNADGWFDRILELELRTEKEVEIKFIVPLLLRLGYSDRDRYDGMPVPAAHGSRSTTLVIDFALFNSDLDALKNQPLLTVEAKHERRLRKSHEIAGARNQAKSYCLWTQCDFFMITDARAVEVFDLSRRSLEGIEPVFDCERRDLKTRFGELYRITSREALTRHYLGRLSSVEEAR